ncbi:MAG: hypothetical protein CTY25_11720 [Methylobacterium sp.]|nr:MAG: hypothetical protein CTY25_11720 [Methylobacterium sp.]
MKTLVLPLLALGAAVVTQTLARDARPLGAAAIQATSGIGLTQSFAATTSIAPRPIIVANLDPGRGGSSGK